MSNHQAGAERKPLISNNHSFLAPKLSSDQADSAGQIALQCLLKGYHVVPNDRQLSAISQQIGATQTLDQLAEGMAQVGFEVEQTIIPADLLCTELSSLPLVVVLPPSEGVSARFMILWNRIGPFFQVFDTEKGRRWLRRPDLRPLLTDEAITVSASQWEAVIRSGIFQKALERRLENLGLEGAQVTSLITNAFTSERSRSFDLAVLDGAARMVESMVQEKGVRRGGGASQLINTLLKHSQTTPIYSVIPKRYWSIDSDCEASPWDWEPPPWGKEANDMLPSEDVSLQLRGVTALRVMGWEKDSVRASAFPKDAAHEDDGETSTPQKSESEEGPSPEPVEGELHIRPDLKKYLLADGILPPILFITFTILAATGIFFQSVLFRGMMKLITTLSTLPQRISLVVLIGAFVTTILLLNWLLYQLAFFAGERLNTRLRLALLAIIPNLSSHYFRDASPAEMIDRIHSGRAAEWLPLTFQTTALLMIQLLFTVIGIAWIDWLSGILAVLMLFIFVLGMAGRMQLMDKELVVLENRSKLSQLYSDAMQGLVAIRTHSAERAIRREYESELTSWVKNKLDFHTSEMWFWAYDAVITYLLIILIIVVYAARTSEPANLLLLAYWCINLDQIGRNQLGFTAIGVIYMASNLSRYMELLDTPEERDLIPIPCEEASEQRNFEKNPHGVAIKIREVDVRVGEKTLLNHINLTIPAGSHIAIVGSSGAGKSTLVGLLLGWHYPDGGQLLIDNQPLSYHNLQQLRRETAWVDPNVRLWNRSLLYNLYYADNQVPLNVVVEQADLRGVLERLEDGLQTSLSSEGRALSGGQGQRVRFGRALQRRDARLVILDEAFRGLDRGKRRLLLRRAREFWKNSTVICVTHDVRQTVEFDRVLVLDKGEIIEDGSPQSLAAQPSSRYAALLEAESNVREKLWSKHRWRRLWLEGGKLTDKTTN